MPEYRVEFAGFEQQFYIFTGQSESLNSDFFHTKPNAGIARCEQVAKHPGLCPSRGSRS
jgi:hypothetical protein